MRRYLILFFVALGALGACSDGDTENVNTDTSTTVAEGEGVDSEGNSKGVTVTSVSDDLDSAPEVVLEPSSEVPTEIVSNDVVVGEGKIVEAGATVEVNYSGLLTTGEEFDSSWSRGETITFGLDAVIAGWSEGIPGMAVGGRRTLVIPSDLAYGPDGSPPVIPGDATLIFVVDVVEVFNPGEEIPTTTTNTTTIDVDSTTDLEGNLRGVTVNSVSDDLSVAPEIDLEATEIVPTELLIEDTVVGDGEVVLEGATVEVHYTGVLTTGDPFDSSWERDQTATFPLSDVIPAWTEGIPGMAVGGRRLLVVPSDLGYGPAGSETIPGNATLIFVVDLVSVENPLQPGVANVEVTGEPGRKPMVTFDNVAEAPTETTFTDISVGDGEVVSDGSLLTVHYVGLLGNGEQFDASWDRDVNFDFVLGTQAVIPGWEIGMEGMAVGGRRVIIIPAADGYGEAGAGEGRIPPNATLIFVVDLVAVSDAPPTPSTTVTSTAPG